MNRGQLEHVIRAACEIADDDERVIIGSQAILGAHPDAPASPGTRGHTGWCLEPHDLVVSKYLAGREKDLRFGREAIAHSLVDPALLLARLDDTDAEDAIRTLARARIAAAVSAGPDSRRERP